MITEDYFSLEIAKLLKEKGKVAAYIDNAEYLKEGQELTYLWNGEKTVFTIESIHSDNGGYSSATRLVILSPNDRVAGLPLNATLETEY